MKNVAETVVITPISGAWVRQSHFRYPVRKRKIQFTPERDWIPRNNVEHLGISEKAPNYHFFGLPYAKLHVAAVATFKAQG
jgi:hypothetical protein